MSDAIRSFTLPEGEPAASPWRTVPESKLVDYVLTSAGPVAGRPRIVAVDGRGASGKSTLAERLCRKMHRSAIVHTDDIAWNEPFFAWHDLLADHILRPLHRGENVSFRPPAWDRHAREGSITIPAGLEFVIVEGVGASQRELSALIDATVWMQSDFNEAEARGIARDIAQGVNGDTEDTVAFWHEWMAEELRFVQRQRPWERACVIVAGTPPFPIDADQVAVVAGPL